MSAYAPRGAYRLRRALTLLFAPLLTAAALLAGPAAPPAAACPAGACGSVVTAPLQPPAPAAEPCPSPDPVVCRIRVLPWDEKAEAQQTRMRYHGLLEDMRRTAARMRADGAGDEEIARKLVGMRNQAKEITRAGMSPDEVRILEARNQAKYGNPLGPTADQLHAKYGSWQEVIAASTRTSTAVDEALSLHYHPCPV
ncbi:hypothetical protein [Streptomyces sp. 184]|uniref:hypothetical protein n=1 Tax=Streptomyces sp. 184 TaxID=1827526 RepID=UPI0038917A2F